MFGNKKMIKIIATRQSLISEGVSIEGTINSEGMLEAAGLIKGLLCAKILIIKETGSIIGSIEAELLVINGHFDGNASASEITIGATGTVKGDIEFSSNFKTENGAEIDAKIKKSDNSKLTGYFPFQKRQQINKFF